MYIKINALLMNILYIYERKHLYYIILFFVLAFAYLNKCEKRYTFFKLLKIFHFLSYYASRLKKAHMFQSNSLVYIYISKIVMELFIIFLQFITLLFSKLVGQVLIFSLRAVLAGGSTREVVKLRGLIQFTSLALMP